MCKLCSTMQCTNSAVDLKTGTMKKSSSRLNLDPRRSFICRMKMGCIQQEATAGSAKRLRQKNTLGPSKDGTNYAVVHCTGKLKYWPPSGVMPVDGNHHANVSGSNACLVAIGKLQISSSPNTADLSA